MSYLASQTFNIVVADPYFIIPGIWSGIVRIVREVPLTYILLYFFAKLYID